MPSGELGGEFAPECWEFACGGKSVLETALRVESVEAAVADRHMVLGTTARRRSKHDTLVSSYVSPYPIFTTAKVEIKLKQKKLFIQVSKDQTLSWSRADYRRG